MMNPKRQRTIKMVAGLGFGDEGKGTMVDYLVRKTGADMVVRYNGGAQAGHNVWLDDGRHHTFSQLGSGSFNRGVSTLIGPRVFFDPLTFRSEIQVFEKTAGFRPNVFVCDKTPVITPFHVALNRIKETLRRFHNNAHGSCGMGVGELAEDIKFYPHEVLRVGDLRNADVVRAKLEFVRRKLFARGIEGDGGNYNPFLVSPIPEHSRSVIAAILKNSGLSHSVDELVSMYTGIHNVDFFEIDKETRNEFLHESDLVFEGAQGALLDDEYGFPPHNTWSDMSFSWADDLLRDAEILPNDPDDVEKIGVIRTYHTRHGAGPLPTQGYISQSYLEGKVEDNADGGYQGTFRAGAFDATLFRYGVYRMMATGLSGLALTHADIFDDPRNLVPIVDSYSFRNDGHEIRITYKADNDQGRRVENQFQIGNVLKIAKPERIRGFDNLDEFVAAVEGIAGLPIRYISWGPTESAKESRREDENL